MPKVVASLLIALQILHAFPGYAEDPSGFWELPEISEPSGICLNPDTGIFFIVSDDGTIAAVSQTGVVLHHRNYPEYDLEGITLDRNLDELLAIDERRSRIIFFDPATLDVNNSFDIPEDTPGSFEGIAWGDDASIYLVNQVFKSAKKHAGILKITDFRGDFATDFTITGIRDQSGIHIGEGAGEFFVISDTEDALYLLDESGLILDSHRLPGKSQEGIAIDEYGMVYIAQDSGGILVISMEGTGTE